MYRIGGRQRDVHASVRGVVVGIPLLCDRGSNLVSRTGTGRVSGGQFDWGGRLPKSNGGAQRYAQIGWKSIDECKCRSVLDCETNRSSRDESRD